MSNQSARQPENAMPQAAEPCMGHLFRFTLLLAVTLDHEGRITWCNEHFGALVGEPCRCTFAVDHLVRMSPDRDSDRLRRDFARFVAAAEPYGDFETIFGGPGEAARVIRWTCSPLAADEGNASGLAMIGQDVTQSRQAETQARRMSSLYQLLSQTNSAIVRCRSRDELFTTVCRISVEQGGLMGAWIGMREGAPGTIVPSAWQAAPDAHIEALITGDASGPDAWGPTGVAFGEGRLTVIDDIARGAGLTPWADKARAAGVLSVAAIPLSRGGQTVGALTLYAGTAHFFAADFLVLVQEMAEDISYALDNFETEEINAGMRESLRLSEEKYRVLADHAQDWEFWMGTEERYVYVSPACEEICGYLPEDFIRDPSLMERIVVADDRPIYGGHMEHLAGDPSQKAQFEFRIRHKDGGVRWIEHACHSIFRADGSWLGRRGLNRDITRRKEAEQQLSLAASVFENAREAIVLTGADEKIIAVNPAFTDVTGYAPDDVMGKSPKLLGSGRHGPEFFAAMWKQIRQCGYWQGELWNRRKDGEIYPTLLVITQVVGEHGEVTHYIGISADISRQKQSEALISHMADYDTLTDLPNRALLRDRAERAMAMADRDKAELAVMYLDLDRFKTINDSLGHGVGDKFLQAVAGRLESEVREVDTVGRLGGDEFLLILPRTDANGAAMLARKLSSAIAKPIEIEGHALSITPSIGISIFPRDGDGFDSLLKAADIAADKAKESGRNTYQFFSPAMNEAAFQRLLIENALRHALERGEFRLHYQPQINARTGGVIGYEALIRWQHPEMGMIPPAKFIPMAEETGLIEPIGTWVLREACRQAKAWQDQGLPPLRMAVNFSSRQFGAADVLQTIEQALRDTGLNPCDLEIEITESLLMRNPAQVLGTLRAIKALGIHISIDDFGTGYSSLSYLKQFPIDKLKIDQSFIRHVTHDPSDASIVRAIVALARGLRLETIAEGVETEAQFTFLRALHCDEIQGYLFSRPVPPEEIPKLGTGYQPPVEPDNDATLLLVDDENNVLKAIARLLRNQGYRILTASGGEEGLEILARNRVQVVLSDQRMEGMTGTEFLSRVKTIHPDAVRMILSGYGDIDVVTDAINKGEIYRYISKPWDNAHLLATVHDAFAHYQSSKD